MELSVFVFSIVEDPLLAVGAEHSFMLRNSAHDLPFIGEIRDKIILKPGDVNMAREEADLGFLAVEAVREHSKHSLLPAPEYAKTMRALTIAAEGTDVEVTVLDASD